MIDPVGQMKPGRVLAGKDTCPAGRAHRAGGVGVIKGHAAPEQPVDVRCFVKLAPLAGQIHPAKVIQKDYAKVKYNKPEQLAGVLSGAFAEWDGSEYEAAQ